MNIFTKKLNIGFIGFEPFLTDDTTVTSAPCGLMYDQIFKHYENLGHTVFNGSVGEYSDRNTEYIEMIDNCDVIINQLRWPMPNKLQRHKAFLRQINMYQRAAERGIPILIHDEDMKFDPRPHLSGKYLMTTPAFSPKNCETLFFPYANEETNFPFNEKMFHFSYVGNNYERYEQMKNYYGGEDNEFSGYNINIWGNWLEGSLTRESPEKVVSDFPCVEFYDRVPLTEVKEILSFSHFTHHFAKPEYNEVGLVAMRWVEASSAGCVAILPDEFNAPDEVKQVFSPDWRLALDDENYYKSVLESQRDVVSEFSDINKWMDLLVTLL